MCKRNNTKVIKIGNKVIGGGNPVLIQSMTNTDTENVRETVSQILRLEKKGCDIIRCAVPTPEAAVALKEIKNRINIPLVADIHFDYRLAIQSIENGADKIRINPGNIGGKDKVKEVVAAAREKNIPVRVGVNGGSLEKEILEKEKCVNARGLVESAMKQVSIISDMGYDNLVVSIKASDVLISLEAYRLFSEKCNFPLHVGITEAGTLLSGTVKSSVGAGLILAEGIGDTIRVSLTDDPENEIYVAKEILKSLHLRDSGIEIVSCPTCGRTKIDLIGLAKKVHDEFGDCEKHIKVAVMGCVVNGPGEAKEADLGIAGGDGVGIVIKKGEIIKKVPESELLEALREEIDNWQE